VSATPRLHSISQSRKWRRLGAAAAGLRTSKPGRRSRCTFETLRAWRRSIPPHALSMPNRDASAGLHALCLEHRGRLRRLQIGDESLGGVGFFAIRGDGANAGNCPASSTRSGTAGDCGMSASRRAKALFVTVTLEQARPFSPASSSISRGYLHNADEPSLTVYGAVARVRISLPVY
jgi:hypothetical protein